MLKREEGWRNRSDVMGRCAIGTIVVADPHLHTLAGTDRSSRAFGCHRNLRQHPTTQKTVRRFRHRDHTSADGLGFQVTIEDEPALLRRSARTGGQDPKLQSQYHIPSNADHLWAVTATPSHAKYLSENFGITQRCFCIPAVNPVLQVLPRHFQRPSEDDHQRGYRRRWTVFTQAHHHQLTPSQRQRPGRTTILRPQVTLDAAPSPKSRERYGRQHHEKLPVVMVNTMPVQYDHLPVVNSATLFMDTDCCVCYEPMDDRVACPCRHTFCFQCLSMIAANQLQRTVRNVVLHSRIGIPCRRRGRTRTGTCTGGRQNALNLHRRRWPTLSGSTKNAQAPVKRSSL
jgi:hypothetical protein